MKTPEDLFAYLASLGIPFTNHSHEPTFTVADSHRIKQEIPGAQTKNLLLKVKKKRHFVLVHMLGNQQLAIKPFAKEHSLATLSFATGDQLFEILKVTPGHVSPFSLLNFDAATFATEPGFCLEVILDADLFSYDIVNFHPLQNHMTTGIAKQDLCRFLESLAINYRILALPKIGFSNNG